MSESLLQNATDHAGGPLIHPSLTDANAASRASDGSHLGGYMVIVVQAPGLAELLSDMANALPADRKAEFMERVRVAKDILSHPVEDVSNDPSSDRYVFAAIGPDCANNPSI